MIRACKIHSAIGQFINYRIILEQLQPDRILYLAVPSEVYNSFFEGRFAQIILQKINVKIIVYESEEEVVNQWIK